MVGFEGKHMSTQRKVALVTGSATGIGRAVAIRFAKEGLAVGVNLKGTFFCSRAALPHLQNTSGSIVNITSVAGLQGHGSSIPYAASKAAVNCMTKSLARAFGPKVRVNAVAPGPVLTRWLTNHMDQVVRAIEVTPMKRAATPDDVADVVEFLALGSTL